MYNDAKLSKLQFKINTFEFEQKGLVSMYLSKFSRAP